MASSLLDRPPVTDLDRFVDITRREFVIGVSLAGLLTLPACGDDADGDEEDGTGSGTRTFVDSTGTAVEVPDRPQRIVATHDESGGAQLLAAGAPVVGMASRDGELLPSFAEFFDVDGITLTGEHFEPNLEVVAELRPDLIVHAAYDGEITLEPEVVARLREIAPVVGIDTFRPIDEVMADIGELIGGASADQLAAQRAELDAAVEELRGALGPDPAAVTGSFVISFQGVLEAWGPSVLGPTNLLSQAGIGWVPLMVEADLPENGGYIPDVSFERIPEMSADLVLVETSFGAGEIMDHPLFRALPAAQAGQVIEIDSSLLSDLHYPGLIAMTRYLTDQISAMDLRSDLV